MTENLKRHITAQRGHLHFAAERRNVEGDGHLRNECPIRRVRTSHARTYDFDKQIAGRAAARATLAFTGQAQARTGIHAGGNG